VQRLGATGSGWVTVQGSGPASEEVRFLFSALCQRVRGLEFCQSCSLLVFPPRTQHGHQLEVAASVHQRAHPVLQIEISAGSQRSQNRVPTFAGAVRQERCTCWVLRGEKSLFYTASVTATDSLAKKRVRGRLN